MPLIHSSRVVVVWIAAMVGICAAQDENLESAGRKAIEAQCDASGLRSEYDQVMTHLSGVASAYSMPRRLKRVAEALKDPWATPRLCRELRDSLFAPLTDPKQIRPSELAAVAHRWLDEPISEEDEKDTLDDDAYETLTAIDRELAKVMDPERVDGAALDALAELVKSVASAVERAKSEIEPTDRAALHGDAKRFLEGWYRTHFPKGEIAAELLSATSAELRRTQRVDRHLLRAIAKRVAILADPEFTAGFSKRVNKLRFSGTRPEGISGDVLAIVGEGAQRVVIGGPGKTEYSAPCAFVFDVGGNDIYHVAADATEAEQPLSIVIDSFGDDVYDDTKGAIGASVAGISILVDRAGNDRYECHRFGQAASIAGFALLLDEKGNDKFTLEDFGQGCGIDGVALFVDLGGKDLHDAYAYAQGASLGPGFGALIDTEGDDTYLADRHWPDVYGDSGPEVFHGASQGYSTGVRKATADGPFDDLPGGIGVLLDRAGKDRYQAGNFAQGGGYYFSLGLMYDGGGDDETIGTRYGQGFGVHQAVGMRWDAGGNDVSRARVAANIGSAWDEGCGFFLDEAGDDTYEAGGLALGGAANTALAVFADLGGSDKYTSGNGADCQGGFGDRSYHQLSALGVLLDLGGGKDTYTRPGRKNDATEFVTGMSLFVDTKKAKLSTLQP